TAASPAAKGVAAELWGLDANLGRLDRRGALTTDRLQFDARLGRAADRVVRARWQDLDTRNVVPDDGRTRRFRQANARHRSGFPTREATVEGDEFVRGDTDSLVRPSYRYLDTRLRLGTREARRTTAAVEWGRRDTDDRLSATQRASTGEEWRSSRR